MKRHIYFALTLLAIAAPAMSSGESPKTEDQKTLYAIGQAVVRSLEVFTLSPTEFEIVKQGITESYEGKKSDVDSAVYTLKVQELAKARRKAAGERQLVAGMEYLEKAAKENRAIKTESGMVYIQINEGKGASPKASDIVKVNYRGTLIDGKEFDSSYKRGSPLEFKLDNVIKCWTEGVQKMKPGGKARLVCPANLAYGDNGVGEQILPGATLVFEVDLLEFKPSPDPKAAIAPALPAPAKSGGK